MAEDKILATVNGQDVTESQLEIAAAQSKINYKEITPEQKKLLTEALVNRQLVLGEAIKNKYDKDPDITARIKALTDSYIAANYLATVAEKYQSSEDEMMAYYEKNVINNTPREYKARHILVKTEDEAKALIKEIKGGADFSELAKEKSTDTGSATKGGDLGWFTQKDMVASFSKAVAGLKKGELAQAPINSQFGWHVIILDDERATPPPEFTAVKQDIDKILIKIKLNTYLSDLNANAKIELK
ncbi:MAG: peptidylprolyl isomerase [gamma proteobacterium symbiont of Bathyaustriella thionipta]|nr:peptidylprolyl isomerase [gamma proteobacterium symbiont of Bathyaustriella thionipta]MCU7950756.1 peptidylprolyl isomerase [gamma proteobacterium symbiont of Bathyaustriella thionipta]MCU7952764.1 peptidylprolyl isomerase [gamma proteobacterium symbiont of Bathyaustriella thionipta]MCU7957264.1 peptidylprolyl isomerase [gamma proteobacterium symbiont of Bathyaustriella thionipta]MCU7968505.1 peptidylprolyl isomerase [gamma proteobacterium symbiont of Bathyaustriella thionipta]